jgi:Hexapeptide repeat of succinyl-transferase
MGEVDDARARIGRGHPPPVDRAAAAEDFAKPHLNGGTLRSESKEFVVKNLLKALIRLTKPVVWRLAQAYDLRVDRPLYASGQNPLVIEGDREAVRGRIAKSVYFNTRSGSIVIGENTLIAEDVMVLTGKHLSIEEASTANLPLHHVPLSGRDIRIGSGCFIGSGAIIVGPVEIGDHAVIGAGSVVTRNVPPRVFVAGVPARVIRVFSEPATSGAIEQS